MKIIIKNNINKEISFNIKENDTIFLIKIRLREILKKKYDYFLFDLNEKIDVKTLNLEFDDKILCDEQTVKYYNIQEGSIIYRYY